MKLPYRMDATPPTLVDGNIATTVTVTDATGRVILNRTLTFAPTSLRNVMRDSREVALDAIYADLTLDDLAGVTWSWQIGLDTSLRNLDLL